MTRTYNFHIPDEDLQKIYSEYGSEIGFKYKEVVHIHLRPYNKFQVMNIPKYIWDQVLKLNTPEDPVVTLEFLEPKVRDEFSRGAPGSCEYRISLEQALTAKMIIDKREEKWSIPLAKFFPEVAA